MAYVGGKAKGSEHIIEILNNKKYDNLPYLEPFVGYGHILRRVKNKKSYTASDGNPLVVSLLQGIQDKKKKYPNISREDYYKLKKKLADNSFKRAIAAFCYSYNGKEWGGYTTISSCERRENYPLERKNYYNQLRQNDVFMQTKITHNDYKKLNPKGCLIYCDPPYAKTTGYSPHFNHHEFWDIMRKWSINNHVFISEYNAPKDFKCVAKKSKTQSLNGKGAGKVVYEKLFKL
uniref:site-specific DNA-methyltransferase (adenine-specific) n=1 Tax=viral metagenome TaxID=1070528 RepID=A0A6C0F959_9ZZZZ|tara:strand:+ start:2710 stop:3408 length:699 start_codon:yes stop_codon:yes gene_type:complete